MFDKFGEIGSAGELNELAGNLRKEGDGDSVLALAEENGVDAEVARAFLDGELDFLADEVTAAIGKVEVEAGELKPVEIMEDWTEYVKVQCLEDPEMAKAVRSVGRSLKGCVAALLKWSFGSRYKVDDEIVKKAGIGNARVEMGIPGMGTAKRIIREYYLGGGKE